MEMNKKNRILLTITAFLSIFFGMKNIYADCTYQEKANLNSIAGKVKTNYEIIEKTTEEPGLNPDTGEEEIFKYVNYSFKIKIYNLTEDLYVTQKNSLSNETKTILFSDTIDSIYAFETDDQENIISYEYNVYSNLENCKGDILRTYSFKKPKRNILAELTICKQNSDVPFCSMFINEDYNIDSGAIMEAIEKYVNRTEIPAEEKQEKNKLLIFLKNNYIYIIIGVVVVGGGTGATIYILRKRSAL